jgi:hypothetical protein
MLPLHIFLATLPVDLPTSVTIEVLDDRLLARAGVDLKVEQSGLLVATTGSDGIAGPLAGLTEGPLLVTLRETPQADGKLLGAITTEWVPGPAHGSQTHLVALAMTQPLALPMDIQGLEEQQELYLEGAWPLVEIVVPAGSNGLNAAPLVAQLPDHRSTHSVLDYYGAATTAQYDRGFFLETRAMSFGSKGLIIELDCAELGYSSTPALAWHHFHPPLEPGAPISSSPPTVTFLGWEEDFLYFHLHGGLAAGRHVFAVRERLTHEPFFSTHSWEVSTPTGFEPGSSSAMGEGQPPQSSPLAAAAMHLDGNGEVAIDCSNPFACEPPAPLGVANPTPCSSPPAPTSWFRACSPLGPFLQDTRQISWKLGPSICLDHNDSTNTGLARSYSFSSTVGFKSSSGGVAGGPGVQATHSETVTIKVTLTNQINLTAGLGSGCGECFQPWLRATTSLYKYVLRKRELHVDIELPDGPFELPSVSISRGPCVRDHNVRSVTHCNTAIEPTKCSRIPS